MDRLPSDCTNVQKWSTGRKGYHFLLMFSQFQCYKHFFRFFSENEKKCLFQLSDSITFKRVTNGKTDAFPFGKLLAIKQYQIPSKPVNIWYPKCMFLKRPCFLVKYEIEIRAKKRSNWHCVHTYESFSSSWSLPSDDLDSHSWVIVLGKGCRRFTYS